MDAKERLRRYLEQRRELGESELVLDGMPVEDVMSLISGKIPSPPARSRSAERVAGADGVAAPTRQPDADVPSSAPSESMPVHARADNDDPPVASSPATPPPEPERRFDATASTDWRETLRKAGAARPSPTGRADAPPDEEAPALPRPVIESVAAGNVAPEWLTELGVPLGLVTGDTATRIIEPAIAVLPTLDALAEMVRVCTRCDLHRTAINPVPGEGDLNADFVCVGEAPGQNEDEHGRPFVGAAGSLLNKILGAIQLSREEVFVCNVLKHRPPGNRDPLPDEVRACEPYLRRQLELIKPRVILALGRFAAQSLLQTTTPIGKLRGQIHRYHGVPLIATYHPAALLRNEAWKRPTWDDVRLARRVLDASRAAAGQ